MRSWARSSPEILRQIDSELEDRFAAKWIKNNREDLSDEAIAVLDAARNIYKLFYMIMSMIDLTKPNRYKINYWDVGWYQIRMTIKDNGKNTSLSKPMGELSAKLLPQIYELGFLRDEVRYF